MNRLVIVRDDWLTVGRILCVYLGHADYAVKAFPDGAEASLAHTTEACPPARIFVDLGLPKLDGYEVIRLLKRARPALEQTILVILSRRDGVQDRLKGRRIGAYAYLTKPFKADHFASAVRTSLEETVPGSEQTVRFREHEMVSSQDTTRSRTLAEVFPPR